MSFSIALATVLSCAIKPVAPAPAPASIKVMLNIVLNDATAAEMAKGEPPNLPIRFIEDGTPARGWILHNSLNLSASVIGLQRVTRVPTASMPFFIRAGFASRRDDGLYTWKETSRGPCRLIAKDMLP